MLSQRLLDFDDLLYYAYMILSLKDNEIYQQIYGHLYVDETRFKLLTIPNNKIVSYNIMMLC